MAATVVIDAETGYIDVKQRLNKTYPCDSDRLLFTLIRESELSTYCQTTGIYPEYVCIIANI